MKLKCTEDQFEAYISLRQLLEVTLPNYNINEEILQLATDEFGDELVQEAIKAWNEQISNGEALANKRIREILGIVEAEGGQG